MHQTETVITDLPKLNSWDGVNRRRGAPQAPLFAEMLLESQWRPSDVRGVASEGWMRAYGYAGERRR